MSELLKAFLRDWLTWAEGAADKHAQFSRDDGLCHCLHMYAKAAVADVYAVRAELKGMFLADGLDWMCPFGLQNYWKSADGDAMHLDPNRLAWVRSKLETHA